MVLLYSVVVYSAIALAQPTQAPAPKKDLPAQKNELPAPKNELKFSNVRLTYGPFGATRSNAKFLGGDTFFLAFDVEGITQKNETGLVKYSMSMELFDSKNVSIFKQPTSELEEELILGGNRFPARAYLTIGATQAPGLYTCKITVTDRFTGAKKDLEQKLEILPKNLGIISAYLSYDELGRYNASPTAVVGQSLWLQFAIINFDRGGANKQPDCEFEMTIYEKGTPVPTKPIKESINKLFDEKADGFPLHVIIPLSRVGDFTVELKATDKLSKKVDKLTVPLRVINANDR